jgi:hypothetical protein
MDEWPSISCTCLTWARNFMLHAGRVVGSARRAGGVRLAARPAIAAGKGAPIVSRNTKGAPEWRGKPF